MKKLASILLIPFLFLLSWQASAAAAVPAEAYGKPVPEKGYILDDLGDGLYWVSDGMYQVMFLTTGKGVIVVDAPPSMTHHVLAAIKEVTMNPITHVIYSHSHADHIAGAAAYPKDAKYIAHIETANRLKAKRDTPFGMFVGGGAVPAVTGTFENDYRLVVGNQVLELSYKGPSHVPGNLLIYAPKQKVLMFIDVIFPGWSPFKWLAVAEFTPSFIESHDWVLAYDFDTLISGHIGRRGSRADVVMQKQYIMDIQTNAVTSLKTVDFNAIAGEIGFANPWLLFNTYLDALADKCTKLTEDKWVTKLGGVDIFTFSHCEKVIESLRID
ncbi:MAG: MBL fold metallo-hydrolase [Saccharospirillaceae bacterium]|nr:MBL fold metallo-hydrolase [Pseudomonadales bacterium]NRB80641.1 MBL fold metallo-hydrolase [Saccharospirillaceae bacterium]